MENKILDKIKKLLTLAKDKSATQNEVEIALAMAEKLSKEHQIDINEIDLNIGGIDYEYISIDTKTFEPKHWINELCSIIAYGYNCELIRHTASTGKKYMRLIGFKEDVEMCEEVTFTTKMIIREMANNQWLINGKQKEFRSSYILGFLEGLHNKLKDERKEKFHIPEQAEKYGLIVKKKNEVINEYISEQYTDLKKGRRYTMSVKDSEAYFKGIQDGKQQYTGKHLNM